MSKFSHSFFDFLNQVTLESILETQLMMEEVDGQSVELVWRGDGQFFAISFLKSQQRCFSLSNLDFYLYLVDVLQSLKELL